VLGARELGRPDWPPGSVIHTGPDEANLRVVDVLATESDDPEMHFTVLVVEPAEDVRRARGLGVRKTYDTRRRRSQSSTGAEGHQRRWLQVQFCRC
jgi:hypothetical protein